MRGGLRSSSSLPRPIGDGVFSSNNQWDCNLAINLNCILDVCVVSSDHVAFPLTFSSFPSPPPNYQAGPTCPPRPFPRQRLVLHPSHPSIHYQCHVSKGLLGYLAMQIASFLLACRVSISHKFRGFPHPRCLASRSAMHIYHPIHHLYSRLSSRALFSFHTALNGFGGVF